MPWNPHLCTAFHQQPHVPPLSSLLGAPGSVWPVHPSNTLHWIPQAPHSCSSSISISAVLG